MRLSGALPCAIVLHSSPAASHAEVHSCVLCLCERWSIGAYHLPLDIRGIFARLSCLHGVRGFATRSSALGKAPGQHAVIVPPYMHMRCYEMGFNPQECMVLADLSLCTCRQRQLVVILTHPDPCLQVRSTPVTPEQSDSSPTSHQNRSLSNRESVAVAPCQAERLASQMLTCLDCRHHVTPQWRRPSSVMYSPHRHSNGWTHKPPARYMTSGPPSFFCCLLMRDLWMWGMTPPPAMVACGA